MANLYTLQTVSTPRKHSLHIQFRCGDPRAAAAITTCVPLAGLHASKHGDRHGMPLPSTFLCPPPTPFPSLSTAAR
jgi:hypothetical protein